MRSQVAVSAEPPSPLQWVWSLSGHLVFAFHQAVEVYMVALVTQCCWDVQVLWEQNLEIKHNLCCHVWILLLKTTPSPCEPAFVNLFSHECICYCSVLIRECTDYKSYVACCTRFVTCLARYIPLSDFWIRHTRSQGYPSSPWTFFFQVCHCLV